MVQFRLAMVSQLQTKSSRNFRAVFKFFPSQPYSQHLLFYISRLTNSREKIIRPHVKVKKSKINVKNRVENIKIMCYNTRTQCKYSRQSKTTGLVFGKRWEATMMRYERQHDKDPDYYIVGLNTDTPPSAALTAASSRSSG